MVELTKKIIKLGGGYAILIPKALVECKVFEERELVKIKIDKIDWRESSPLEQPEPKPLKKTSLEALREKPVLLTLIRAVDSICFYPSTFNCITGMLRTGEPLAV